VKDMILVTGGYCQGKLAFAEQQFVLREEEIADGAVCQLDAFAGVGAGRESAEQTDTDTSAQADPSAAIRALNHFHLLLHKCQRFPISKR
jgi:hypothetical protein